MKTVRTVRRTAVLAALGLATTLQQGCSDRDPAPLTGPSTRLVVGQGRGPDIRAALAAQVRHTDALLRIPGVVGTAVGLLPNGQPAVRIFLTRPDVAGVPSALDGLPVAAQVTGQFVAYSDPTTRLRPAPVGFSVGHPAITAGTIGARVVDAGGNVYVLSNNHVLANGNAAALGDPAFQPGPFDGGTAADQIGTLFAFQAIDFSAGGANTIDAAIALSSAAELGNATPTDDGYGTPGGAIFGDANQDGLFDDKNALLGLTVQKYGRTTKLTRGQITGINATVTICYEPFFIFCLKSARFVDQLIIEPGSFSGGGDSGSLLVTDDQNKNPVALLFAGSATQTIANRIDLVLTHFGVSVDGGESPPPADVTDLAITGVSAPAFVTEGSAVNVVVTVRNAGNQAVDAFTVDLRDATEAVTIGTEGVPGLEVGATATVTFAWQTAGAATGPHTLTASHDFTDENPTNNDHSTTVMVNAPSSGVHIGDLDGFPSNDGTTWSATVELTVHDANHTPLNGVHVTGTWNRNGLNANECTTGDLGGNGTCIVLFPALKKSVRFVTFTVNSAVAAGRTYDATQNHDVDGSSNGTSVRVNKP